MDFPGRIEKSEKTLNLFVGWCKENNVSYAFSGYEKLKQSREFKETLQKLDSVTAQRIRYFPDIIIANKKAWLIEIKNSIFIEKAAYETYIDLSNIGYNVAIVDIYENQLLFINIIDLRLKYIEKSHIPLIDHKWLCPRLWLDKESEFYNPQKYHKWKEKSGGSGTPHGKIDFEYSEKTILIKNIIDFERKD